jgi:hypothetical protein
MARGAFEIPGSEVFASLGKLLDCPECKSKNVRCVARDPVWEETDYLCEDCGHEWTTG